MEVLLSQFIGYSLKAADGEVGTVSDFCFDDRSWKVQYLVIATDDLDRDLLISPGTLLHADVADKTFSTKISRSQIYLDLKIEKDVGIVEPANTEFQFQHAENMYHNGSRSLSTLTDNHDGNITNTHLNSYKRTQAVAGSVVQSSDTVLGKVFDYIIEDTNWKIRYMVIRIEKSISQKCLLMDCRNLHNVIWSEGVAELNL